MIVANEISGSVSFFQVIMAPEVNLSNKSACKLNPIQLANIDEYGVDNSVLYGSGDYQYEWSYPSLLNNANSENPYYLSPISSRTFTLKISDNQTGLSATGTMNVVVNSVATFSLPVSVRHPKNTSLDLTTLPTGVTGTMPFNYIWTNQSGNVIIDPTDVIPALGFNKYYLTIQDANGCYSANKRVIVYVSPLSKEGTYQDNLVNSQNGSGFAIFYPVPADNVLNIISEFDTENQLFIEIYDLNGKKVINETRNFSTQNTTLNISNVSSGAYTIILRCGEDIIYGNIIKK